PHWGVARYPAVTKLNHTISISRIVLRVRDLNDAGTVLVETAEEFHDLFRLAGMKIPCGLIGQNDARISSYSSCDAYQLLLSTGQLVRTKLFLPADVQSHKCIA